MNNLALATEAQTENRVQRIFAKQREASRRDPFPSLEVRLQHLDLVTLTGSVQYTRKRLGKWMKPQKRHLGLAYVGGENKVIPQPIPK